MPARKTTAQFIEDARKVHGDKYDYSLVEYVNSTSKVKIVCSEHGVFEQTPLTHIHDRSGCRVCWENRRGKSAILTNSEFIEKARLVHGEMYDYSLAEYKGTAGKVKIICKVHGAFFQVANVHLCGSGCSACKSAKLSDLNRLSLPDFLKKAKETHGSRYDYSQTVYKGGDKKIAILCKEHGVFYQRAIDHIKGRGCWDCSFISGATKRSLGITEFIKKAKAIHGNTYDYSLVFYKNSSIPVEIKCKKHGFFKQSPNSHMNGSGCPFCNESKGERKISQILIKQDISFIRQMRFDRCRNINHLPFDFYIQSHNILIEFDGKQHFLAKPHWGGEKALQRVQKHDQIKNRFAERRNIRLVRIPYTEYDRIEEILSEALKLEYQPLQLSLFAA
jgi:very-short-patch-repair endonuclease